MNPAVLVQMASSQAGQQILKEIFQNYRSCFKAQTNHRTLEAYISLYDILQHEVNGLLKKLDGNDLAIKDSEQFIADFLTYFQLINDLEQKIEKFLKEEVCH